jgi:hypothetical protein
MFSKCTQTIGMPGSSFGVKFQDFAVCEVHIAISNGLPNFGAEKAD